MSDNPISSDLLSALGAYDTPTICNALEIVAPERRAIGFTTEPLVAARPMLPPIVGFARTATIRAMQPSRLDPAELRQLRLGYYEYVASGPMPATSPMVIAKTGLSWAAMSPSVTSFLPVFPGDNRPHPITEPAFSSWPRGESITTASPPTPKPVRGLPYTFRPAPPGQGRYLWERPRRGSSHLW